MLKPKKKGKSQPEQPKIVQLDLDELGSRRLSLGQRDLKVIAELVIKGLAEDHGRITSLDSDRIFAGLHDIEQRLARVEDYYKDLKLLDNGKKLELGEGVDDHLSLRSDALFLELSKFAFSSRMKKALKWNGMFRVGDVISLTKKQFGACEKMGASMVAEMEAFLRPRGLDFGMVPKAHWDLVAKKGFMERIQGHNYLSKELVFERPNGCVSIVPAELMYTPMGQLGLKDEARAALVNLGFRYLGDLGAVDLDKISAVISVDAIAHIKQILLEIGLEPGCLNTSTWISTINPDYLYE